MYKKILDTITTSTPMHNVLKDLKQRTDVAVKGVPFAAQSFTNAVLFRETGNSMLVVTADEKEARVAFQDMQTLLGEANVLYYPAFKRQLWNELGPPAALVGHRLQVLKTLLMDGQNLVVAPASAMLENVLQPELAQKGMITLNKGKDYPFDELIEELVTMGYVREQRVDLPGEMSVRGGLVDVFMFEAEHPYRIEFFGNEIESIRRIDIESQRSIQQCDELCILPLNTGGMYGPFDDHPEDHVQFHASLTEYLDKNTIVCFSDYATVESDLENTESDMELRVRGFAHEHKIKDLPFQRFYSGYKSVLKAMDAFVKLEYIVLQNTFNRTIDFFMRPAPAFAGKMDLLKQHLDSVVRAQGSAKTTFLYCCDSETQANRMQDLFVQEDVPEILKTLILNISEGFVWPDYHLYLYTNKELYSRTRYPRQDAIERRKVSLRELSAMNIGDYVVHEEHGIGVFRGLKKIQAYGKDRECLVLEYQDDDTLYVPLEKMHKVQKYSGKEGATPHLNKLGTKTWEKLKSRTKQNIKEVAQQLIKLYASRKMQPGYAFAPDSIWQKELEASFKFDETNDQLEAIQAIKKDMEAEKPMDRLVCGDVGFGKTEVAIRAAFKAISDGRQVAILVPTTILAQQHLETFTDRLKSFPVSIDMLSRFKTPNQEKTIIEKLANGELDLVVGTHKLLSAKIKFKRLGLIIVDEEQRFGVMHKEKLKMLRASVDTLTLSATPIPRTMHMSLIGAKDMSLINTPPQNRIPIKTEVARFDRDYIREIILKEIDRGGQVFFVHNRVQSIYGIAGLLREIVPEVSVAVGHGQMKGHELEKVMLSFSSGKVQCLVCTMIIESGIDMPNANTLIINRADKLGLAQLYQLRGRVGRSDQQAYAYLLVPPIRKLTQTAVKRLQTIQEMSHLGSGYKVAMRDLEIRGTGNLFGPQQSGFIEALGYDVYIKVIEEAIHELKKEMNLIQEEEPEALFEPQIELRMDAFLPEKYIVNPSERVDIYRRFAEAKTEKAVADLVRELSDRFGPLPGPARILSDYILLKVLSEKALVSKLKFLPQKIWGQFAMDFVPTGEGFKEWFGKVVAGSQQKIEVKQQGSDLYFEIKVYGQNKPIEMAKNFLQSIQ